MESQIKDIMKRPVKDLMEPQLKDLIVELNRKIDRLNLVVGDIRDSVNNNFEVDDVTANYYESFNVAVERIAKSLETLACEKVYENEAKKI